MAYTDIDKPSDYFNTILWTGASDTAGRSFTGVGFRPDLVWSKIRDDTYNHNWFDSVRTAGSDKELNSNTTGAEGSGDTDGYGFISSFDTDGFTSAPGTASGGRNLEYNQNGNTFVAWNWKAGTSVSGTTTGSGTGKAYTGSVSTDAGFSIIKYIGNGTAGHQIPHHLNSVPKMIILKNITGGSENWFVYHASLGNTKDIHLNTTGASATADSWNNTTPTSTVWTMSDQSAINSTDGNDHIAYCFSEKKGYSKFGKYTSINSHDSTFVYLGFKPSMIIFKNTSYSGGSDWNILDRTRYTFNGSSEAVLEPNTSDAENYSAFGEVDFLSNGFKIRNNNGVSSGGYDHIYMAFAENPFVTSTGVPATAR